MAELLKKEWVKRALRTFLQAAIGYVAVNIVAVDWSEINALKTGLMSVGAAALSAGLAAVMNLKPASENQSIEAPDSDAVG